MNIKLESTTVRISGTPDEIMEVVNKLPEGSNVRIGEDPSASLYFLRYSGDWVDALLGKFLLSDTLADNPELIIYATIPAGCGLPMEFAEMKESLLVNMGHGVPAIGWKEAWQGADSWLPIPEVKK